MFFEQCAHGLIVVESFVKSQGDVGHMAERAVCNLSVEVPSLIASESEILLALLRQYLYTPAYLVGFKALRDTHCQVGSDDDVPILVVAVLDEEDTYDFLAYEAVDDEVPAVVLGHLLGFRALIA